MLRWVYSVDYAKLAKLTLIEPGEVKVYLANLTLNSVQNSYVSEFLKNYLFLQKRLPNLFELLNRRQKGHFVVHFDLFLSEVWSLHDPALPPFRSVLLLLQTTRGWEKSRRAVVCSPVRRKSTFQSVSHPRLCRLRGWWVLSWACSLVLLKWTAGSALFWVNSWNNNTLWHTGGGTLRLSVCKVTLSGPQCLTVLPDPGSIRVKYLVPLLLDTA
jgi:hypothetical protein